MRKLCSVFSQRAFTLFVFLLCCILFSWTFFTSDMTPKVIFYFLFMAWFFIIFLLFLMTQSCRIEDPGNNHNKDEAADV